MKNMDAAIAAIRTCRTRDTLDDMLVRFELTDNLEVIGCLNQCMYNPQKFDSSFPTSIEDELEFTKQIFLTGTWRLNDYYENMRIPLREKAESDRA